MPPRATFQQDDLGRYQTDGLDERNFTRVFDLISKQNTERRRSGKRTLRPGLLSRKSVQDLVRLGKKQDGTEFTQDDLKRFQKLAQKYRKRRGGLPGITFAELVSRSLDTRIKRANNTSNDRRGISKAQLITLKANIATVRVKASEISDHQEHRVKIRLEEWDELMADADGSEGGKTGYLRAAKLACKGRASFDCSCGDHQYRYRYMATLGNYCLAPPKEFAFPKITNPDLQGLACKHVIRAMTMMQSASWSNVLGQEMARQARRVGYGDDKHTTAVFDGPVAKKLAQNRKTKVDKAKAQAAWKAYQKRKATVAKQLKDNEVEIKKLRQKLDKANRKIKQLKQASQAQQKKNDAQQRQNNQALKDKAAALKQGQQDQNRLKALTERAAALLKDNKDAKQTRQAEADRLKQENQVLRGQAADALMDKLKAQLQGYIDGGKAFGKTKAEAMEQFAKDKGLSLETVKQWTK